MKKIDRILRFFVFCRKASEKVFAKKKSQKTPMKIFSENEKREKKFTIIFT
jgi:lipopolysaccharide export system protein LptA